MSQIVGTHQDICFHWFAYLSPHHTVPRRRSTTDIPKVRAAEAKARAAEAKARAAAFDMSFPEITYIPRRDSRDVWDLDNKESLKSCGLPTLSSLESSSPMLPLTAERWSEEESEVGCWGGSLTSDIWV